MMSSWVCTFVLCFLTWNCVPNTEAYEFWNDLRVTWGLLPGSFNRLPRNTVDADSDGWRNTSVSCTNNGRFYGHRWIDSKDDSVLLIALLFDNNGIVVGMQALIPLDKAIYSGYPYETIPMYQKTVLNGKNFYAVTVYFISPDLICQHRRSATKALLKNIGSSSQVYFQSGPTPAFLTHAPKQRRSAERQGWNSVNCVPGMGWHNFYHSDQWDRQSCREIVPSCLLYTGNEELHGFCLVFPGTFPSKRYETLNRRTITAIFGVRETPQCVANFADSIGFSSVHVYLTNSPWLVGREC